MRGLQAVRLSPARLPHPYSHTFPLHVKVVGSMVFVCGSVCLKLTMQAIGYANYVRGLPRRSGAGRAQI